MGLKAAFYTTFRTERARISLDIDRALRFRWLTPPPTVVITVPSKGATVVRAAFYYEHMSVMFTAKIFIICLFFEITRPGRLAMTVLFELFEYSLSRQLVYANQSQCLSGYSSV